MKRLAILLVAFFMVGLFASHASAQQCRTGYSPYSRSFYQPVPTYRSYYRPAYPTTIRYSQSYYAPRAVPRTYGYQPYYGTRRGGVSFYFGF